MRKTTIIRTLIAAGLGVAALEGVASAQSQPGFVVNRFEPAERGSDWFTLDSLDMRGEMRPAVGLTGQYNLNALTAYNPDGTVNAHVLHNQFLLHVGASFTFLDRFRVGADMPFQLVGDGDAGTFVAKKYAPPANGAALGDLRLGIDFRVYGKYGDPFTGALGFQVALPSGDPTNYTSDSYPRFMPHVAVAGDVGIFTYAARLGFMSRQTNVVSSWGGNSIGSEFNFAGSVGVRLLDRKFIVGPEVFGSTGVSDAGAPFSKYGTPVEGLLGAHYFMPNGIRAGVAAGPGFTQGLGSPDVRVILSVEWAQPYTEPKTPEPVAGPGDRDHDGITDDVDACPDVAGVKSDDPKKNGCPPPPPPSDRDKDGIADADDACPDLAGVKNDDPKKNGCPPDKDGDGIYDDKDACVDVPGVASDDPKKNGCPPDKDGDGIADADDACPDVAGIKSAKPEFNGCPADIDGDTILNEVDACPKEAGKADPDPAKNGCPKAFVQNGQIKILDQVKFKTGSAEILPGKDSQEVLEAVLKVLNDHPEIKKVRIEGHTDNVGNAAFNKKLSGQRAASVVKWLTTKKIDPARLASEGFGQEKPIAPNDKEENRKQNRRVEFHIEQ